MIDFLDAPNKGRVVNDFVVRKEPLICECCREKALCLAAVMWPWKIGATRSNEARTWSTEMGAYNVVPIADVADASEELTNLCVQLGVEHVTDPAHMQIRFLREPLALENFAVSLERFTAGFRPSRGHRHKLQEEVYLLVSGQAEIKLDDEVVPLEPMTAVRVPPETGRALRARGAEDAVVVTIGAPQTSMDDVEFIPDFWRD